MTYNVQVRIELAWRRLRMKNVLSEERRMRGLVKSNDAGSERASVARRRRFHETNQSSAERGRELDAGDVFTTSTLTPRPPPYHPKVAKFRIDKAADE
ncbi:hypothetical protein EVAR_9662_1 [Eumeta japonica]|uniref:Uncharacterized protein n=1 Tax=Eumeta variegata TaxID=151549 RepID=A0A4C1TJV5_EUMVA|nr:hypothetical protein EVAR_9662_1 [Eumeta japonica]